MRKILIIYFICIIVLFFLPALLVKEKNVIATNNSESKQMIIRLYCTENNKIIELDIEEYVMGVLIGEMPVSYELEALKAQAVVARTYTLNKLLNYPSAHEGADMCDDINHCQAYKTKEYALECWDDEEENEKWNKIRKAIIETQNEVITYNGELINAFFHANSGGKTEDILNIWGHENIPYLKSVRSYEDDFRIEEIEYSYREIDEIMRLKYSNYMEITNNIQLDWNNQTSVSGDTNEYVKILEKNSSGRISKMQISNIILEGTEARTLFNLKSTLFEVKSDKEKVNFKTYGYGHGIGLSQDGANSMAQAGANYKEIIKHYYTDVEIKDEV